MSSIWTPVTLIWGTPVTHKNCLKNQEPSKMTTAPCRWLSSEGRLQVHDDSSSRVGGADVAAGGDGGSRSWALTFILTFRQTED